MKKSTAVSAVTLVGIFLIAGAAMAYMTGVLMPAGNGFWGRFFTSGSSSHYQNVDDSSCNGATDYNYTSTSPGAKDSYTLDLSSIPNGSVITRIDVSPCASTYTTGGGNSTLNLFWRWNGLDSPMYGNYVLTSTAFSQLSTTAITGLSYTKVATSTMEIGAYYNAGNLGVRLSNLRTQIYYQ